jgi:hypothetical protein
MKIYQNKILLLFLLLFSLIANAQKRKILKEFENLKKINLNQENTNLSQFNQGKMLEWKVDPYYSNEKFSISEIRFLKNSIGDFNKDGISDIFATLFIESRIRSETNLGLIQINGNTIEIISYKQFSEGYQEFTLIEVENEIVKIRAVLNGINGEVFSDRIVSLAYDPINHLKTVSSCKTDDMKNQFIFNTNVDVKREYYINYSLLNQQTEEYNFENTKITAETHGCDDFTLRFTINKVNVDAKKFNENNYLLEIIAFLKSNTRYPTLLSKIEKDILQKNKANISVSNEMKYDIKNFINDTTYFQIGTTLVQNTYLLDIIYYEER